VYSPRNDVRETPADGGLNPCIWSEIGLVHRLKGLTDHWRPAVRLTAMLAVGFAIRMAIAPFPGGFGYDVATFQNWATTLDLHPMSQFYARAEAPDHLPGDLWIMKALVWSFTTLGGENFNGQAFAWSLKLVPAIADVVVTVTIYLLATLRVSKRDGFRYATWYFLNPVTVFVTAVWSQWDAVSLAVLLIGFLLIVRGESSWMFSSPFFAWAILIKPQLAAPALALIALILFRFAASGSFSRTRIMKFAAQGTFSIALGLVTAVAILLPFSVGLPGMDTRWSLIDRFREALDLYPNTTLGAFNFWMIAIGSLDRPSDVDTRFLGMTLNAWGTVGLIACFAYIAVTMVRAFDQSTREEAVCWAAAVSIFSIFMVPTRVHERYLFPLIGLFLLYVVFGGFRPGNSRLYWAISLVLTLNLLLVYGGFRSVLPAAIRWMTERPGFTTLSCVNVALFAICLALPHISNSMRGQGDVTHPRGDASTQTAH